MQQSWWGKRKMRTFSNARHPSLVGPISSSRPGRGTNGVLQKRRFTPPFFGPPKRSFYCEGFPRELGPQTCLRSLPRGKRRKGGKKKGEFFNLYLRFFGPPRSRRDSHPARELKSSSYYYYYYSSSYSYSQQVPNLPKAKGLEKLTQASATLTINHVKKRKRIMIFFTLSFQSGACGGPPPRPLSGPTGEGPGGLRAPTLRPPGVRPRGRLASLPRPPRWGKNYLKAFFCQKVKPKSQPLGPPPPGPRGLRPHSETPLLRPELLNLRR